jgi:hypothetical protein
MANILKFCNFSELIENVIWFCLSNTIQYLINADLLFNHISRTYEVWKHNYLVMLIPNDYKVINTNNVLSYKSANYIFIFVFTYFFTFWWKYRNQKSIIVFFLVEILYNFVEESHQILNPKNI